MPVRFQVEADFYDHPKSIGLSDAATALWVRAGSYSAAKLLDGFIAEHVLSTLSRSPEAAAEELVARGLWRRTRGGFQFHQYEERNLTKADVEADREYERNRKRERRAATKSAQVNTPSVPPGLPAVVPDLSHRDSGQSPSGSVSVSVSVSESVSESGPGGPEPPRRCRDHQDDPDPPNCRRCGEARRANESWHADRRERLAAAAQCRVHRGQLAHNCALCRAEELANPS
jgi:hypothetical protein